jgi:hypothetical protein
MCVCKVMCVRARVCVYIDVGCCDRRYGIAEEVYSKINLPVAEQAQETVTLPSLERQLEDLIRRRDGIILSFLLIIFVFNRFFFC